jgi:hypothetical protein
MPEKDPKDGADSLASAMARACALGDDVGVAFNIPPAWDKRILKELSKQSDSLGVRQLLTLGEAALRRNRGELAYAASAAGLEKGKETEGRFLVLRARSLPASEFERRADCLEAAAEIGRRRRDMDLVKEAVDFQNDAGRRTPSIIDVVRLVRDQNGSLTDKKINQILAREKRASKFPASRGMPRYAGFGGTAYDEEIRAIEADFKAFQEEQEDFEAFSQMVDEMRPQGTKKKPKTRPPYPGQGELF